MTISNCEPVEVHRRARPSLRHPLYLLAGIVGIAVLLAACGAGSEPIAQPDRPIELLEPDAFGEYLEANPNVDLINVHVPYQGHIDGTDSFVDFEEILDYEGLPEDRTKPVVLYCRSGSMSGQAAAELVEAGFTNVIDLQGGMNAWVDSGRDLVLEEPVEG